MAHYNLHMAVGLVAGSAVALPAVARAWWARAALAPPLRRALWITWLCGAWAIAPHVLRGLGVPDSVLLHPWTNVFFAHHYIDQRWMDRGLLIGELVIAGMLALHYVLTLLALRRAASRRTGA